MKTLTLTAKDFNEYNEYIGPTDLSNFDGHLTIEGGLGTIRFKSLRVTGWITAGAGSGIEAGEGIEAGWGIEAGSGIVTGLSVVCGGDLSVQNRIFAGTATWEEIVTPNDMKVECAKLVRGTIVHGNLIETGDTNAERRAQLEAEKQRIEAELVALGMGPPMTDTCPACNSPDPSTCAYAGHKDRPKGCTNTDEVIEARLASLKPKGAAQFHIDFPAEHIQVTLGERKRINDRIDAAEAHYDPQITALKARVAELEGVLRELVATHRPPSGIWHDEDSPALRQNDAFAAAKATLEPTTSGEGEAPTSTKSNAECSYCGEPSPSNLHDCESVHPGEYGSAADPGCTCEGAVYGHSGFVHASDCSHRTDKRKRQHEPNASGEGEG